ncbi:MAG: ATP-dependent DNA helicase [Steroidobacteraceae bacterium]
MQDQLFHRDLPLLSRALGRAVAVALLKGRSNYLCRERLLRLPTELPLDGAQTLAAQVQHWAGQTREGDLAELPELPDGHPLRERITSTRDSCTAHRCAEFGRCHVFAARRRAAEADLVVVNHHLLLADLALKEEGFGDLLPAADALILDEAHQLPELAASSFGTQFSGRRVERLMTDIPEVLLQVGLDPAAVAAETQALQQALSLMQRECAQLAGGGARADWNADQPRLDVAAAGLVVALGVLADALIDTDPGETIAQLAGRATALAGALDTIASAGESEGARLVSATARSFSCQLVPFEIAARFRALMQSRPAAWIFTSATLAVGDDFSHFQRRLGLDDRCRTLRIDSPFEFARQALLYLPEHMPDPASPDFTEAVVRCAAGLIEASGGGAFLLFTSHRALAAAARLLRATRAELPLLVQGESPREQLLREFRRRDDAVLLGSASFWEGVDVKGRALRLVVIDRLPFASPEDPVIRARMRHARESGGDPFSDFQVPEAALALKQGVGRLIRSEQDEGLVVICDPRLVSRGYGRRLLAALPPMRRSRDAADALQLLRRLAHDGAAAGA